MGRVKRDFNRSQYAIRVGNSKVSMENRVGTLREGYEWRERWAQAMQSKVVGL